MEYKQGQSFRANTPFAIGPRKVHICHVVPSIYEGRTLLIYRVFGIHKRWWHELLCTTEEMDRYIEFAKK